MSTSATTPTAAPTSPGYILMQYGETGKVIKKPNNINSVKDVRTLAAALFYQVALAPPQGFDVVYHTTTMPERPGLRVLIDQDALVEVFPVISDLEIDLVHPHDYPDE